jgi:hypothetical protein
MKESLRILNRIDYFLSLELFYTVGATSTTISLQGKYSDSLKMAIEATLAQFFGFEDEKFKWEITKISATESIMQDYTIQLLKLDYGIKKIRISLVDSK